MEHLVIRKIGSSDKDWISAILKQQWGSVHIVTRGRMYRADTIPGFIALYNNKPSGVITYHIDNNDCEIMTLDSLLPGKGIGTVLIEKVKESAKENNCKRVWLITTNDNIQALRFYQKRGFVLAALYPDAIRESRILKPEIPKIGSDGIPIRDEIELEYRLK